MSPKMGAFWVGTLAKIGPPIFAATLVGCLLKGQVQPIHGVLMAVGFALIYLGHRLES